MAEPDISAWLAEAKAAPTADQCGMYLIHDGVVRATPKRKVRAGVETDDIIEAVDFSYNAGMLTDAIEEAKTYPGIYYVRVWLNTGIVPVGGSLMYVLIGGDIRPHCIDALEKLVGKIKNEIVIEREIVTGAASTEESSPAELK